MGLHGSEGRPPVTCTPAGRPDVSPAEALFPPPLLDAMVFPRRKSPPFPLLENPFPPETAHQRASVASGLGGFPPVLSRDSELVLSHPPLCEPNLLQGLAHAAQVACGYQATWCEDGSALPASPLQETDRSPPAGLCFCPNCAAPTVRDQNCVGGSEAPGSESGGPGTEGSGTALQIVLGSYFLSETEKEKVL